MWECVTITLCTFIQGESVTKSGSLFCNFSLLILAKVCFLIVSSLPISFGISFFHCWVKSAVSCTLSMLFWSYFHSCSFFALATFHGCSLLATILNSSARLAIFQESAFQEAIVFNIEFMIEVCTFTLLGLTTLVLDYLFVVNDFRKADAFALHSSSQWPWLLV